MIQGQDGIGGYSDTHQYICTLPFGMRKTKSLRKDCSVAIEDCSAFFAWRTTRSLHRYLMHSRRAISRITSLDSCVSPPQVMVGISCVSLESEVSLTLVDSLHHVNHHAFAQHTNLPLSNILLFSTKSFGSQTPQLVHLVTVDHEIG